MAEADLMADASDDGYYYNDERDHCVNDESMRIADCLHQLARIELSVSSHRQDDTVAMTILVRYLQPRLFMAQTVSLVDK